MADREIAQPSTTATSGGVESLDVGAGGGSSKGGVSAEAQALSSAVSLETAELDPVDPPSYSQGQLCVRLRIQSEGGGAQGMSNLHITRHSGDVLQFHSFYR